MADFQVLDRRELLRCARDTEHNLLIQSVIGHAHEGHGVFQGRRFPNTTMDDIACALRRDPRAVREDRQDLIDGVGEYIDRVLAGGDGRLLVDDEGQPLLTMGTLALLPEVDGKDVLRGFYLGGMRDDSEVRLGAEARYGLTIGGGDSYLVHLPTMEAMGQSGDRLAHEDHDEATLAAFREAGLIEADEGEDDEDTAYLYIRHRKGCGTSDDACIVLTGLRFGFSAAVGAFLADAVDTLEKYVPVFGGWDKRFAEKIEREMPDLGMGRRDVEDIAYLCADESGEVPDSSLRHLMAVNTQFDQCPIEAHFAFLLGRPYAPLGLSHGRRPNGPFYDYCRQRLAAWERRQESSGADSPT